MPLVYKDKYLTINEWVDEGALIWPFKVIGKKLQDHSWSP